MSLRSFREQRDAFVCGMRMNADLLRSCPLAAEEVSVSLVDFVDCVYRLRDAAVALDGNLKGSAYVRSKPYKFFSHNVPLMCIDIVACLLHWADILVNTLGQRTNEIVVLGIEQMLASMEF
jgi:hypothetical protein